ncbi:MAG: sugar transferase [Actinomycetia bacterium]|nr:sugar transferase [Actinomycetes bacterium]
MGLVVSSAIHTPGKDHFWAIALMSAAYAVWLGQARLYQSRFITRRTDEIRRIVNAGVRSAATLVLVSFIFELSLDRIWLILGTMSTVALLAIDREIMRRWFDSRRLSGRLSRRVLMIGDNAESLGFAAMLEAEPRLGYSVVATIDPALAADPRQLTTLVLASARQNNAHGVVVAATAIDVQSSNRLIRDLVEAGIHVELSSTLADISFDRLTVRPLGRFPVVYIEPRSRHGWRAAAKRLFDVTVASSALICLSPVMVALALLVRLGSSGPILFRQERVGKEGEPFMMLKFRTMVVGAEDMLAELETTDEGAGPLFKMKQDPRVTRIGSFLRKTSLDELPQLWNVIRDEMSLVGPRPALRSEMVDWSEELYTRLRVKPGITGMWQVSGRSSTTFEEYTRLDLYYVDNWSFVVDLAIMARTVPAVIKSRGAY